MSAIYTLLVLSIFSGMVTSIVAYIIHNSRWHLKCKKSSFEFANLVLTNIYQFNGKLFSPVSVSISVATCIILGNIIFIVFYCDINTLGLIDALLIFSVITIVRTLFLFIVYKFLYNQKILSD